MKKVVFLYTELADYFLKCLQACEGQFQFLVIHWPINKEAPFQFEIPINVLLVSKNENSKTDLIKQIEVFQPALICCSGWIDKDYISIIRKFKSKKIRTCISFDNHWRNSLKQKVAMVLSRFTIKNYFDAAWVPGEVQKEYALKLGFKINQIKLGYYCADTKRFNKVFDEKQRILNNKTVPRVFLFVGRYVKHKGIFDLWRAFIELKKEFPNNWQLLCIGTGEEWENRVTHPDIQHLGFKQPNELMPYLLASGVYILPSHFEPWGVSVHEMAISGFPMILSNEVGSAEKFLFENKNGFIYSFNDIAQLKSQMVKMMRASEIDLDQLSKSSNEIGLKLTHDNWKKELTELFE
jgi:glycosyltransferase involved in cell wall biosynthesis